MKRGFGRLVLLAATALATVLVGSGPARAGVTHDLYLWPYCLDSTCGHASVQEFRTYVFDAVQEMNLEWRKAGISFRPILFSVKVDGYYNQTQGCAPGVSDTLAARREEWRASIATAFPLSINMLITQGPNMCCSGIPQGPTGGDPTADAFPNTYGLLCDANKKRGSASVGQIWAHEMGHHWCLAHTFSWQDSAETAPIAPDYDLDTCCGVNDTPPDPGVREDIYDPKFPAVSDVSSIGVLRDGHEWCAATEVLLAPFLVDSGSPHSRFCSVACVQRQDGSNSPLNVGTVAYPTMSYYGWPCSGPYTVNGVTYEPFSKDSIDIFTTCRNGLPERANLPDVCAPRGGDADRDGICQIDDNCPKQANTSQADRDHDGQGDLCDLCPDLPLPTGDIDKDGKGDLCDDDKDGDGCKNSVDQHPSKGKVIVGSNYSSGCGSGTEPSYGFEGDDSDGDGAPNCVDLDDDNDGICDEGGPHLPGERGAVGLPPGGCQPGANGFDPCPINAGLFCFTQGPSIPCPPTWMVCLGGGCSEFFLDLVSLVSPQDHVRFDTFEIVNQKIYITPLAGFAISQSALALQGDFAAVNATAETRVGAASLTDGAVLQSLGDPVRLEIWSRRTNEPVAIIAEYDATQVRPGAVTRGQLLELAPVTDDAGAVTLGLAATWLNPGPPNTPLADLDGDTLPDFADNCTAIVNPEQTDADDDGFGNACDADLDGDLLVTALDIDAVIACDGADLTLTIPLTEPADIGGADRLSPDPALLDQARRCEAADLDGNRIVDGADRLLAEGMLDRPPGPSGFKAVDQGCGPTSCDDGLACTHDYCDPASGLCRSVPATCDDGDPCTVDQCDIGSGRCLSTPLTCDDGNACTRDSCDTDAGGCRHDPELDGITCDDLSRCTERDTCLGGICAGTPLVICDDGDLCTADACNPATGACIAQPLSCDDGNPCTSDLCDGRSGGCVNITKLDGTSCDDGNLCTAGDACLAGACAPGGLTTLVEVPDLRFNQAVTFEWNATPAATHWNSYRGTIPDIGGLGSRPPATRYDHACFESADFMANGPTLSIDLADPPRGTAYYYLASEEGFCGEGPLGFDSAGGARPNAMPCATPP